MSSSSEAKGLRLLSFGNSIRIQKRKLLTGFEDASGSRGISQLKILAELTRRLTFGVQTQSPCQFFDMIGGVGTGGYIAILLVVLGLTAEQALEEVIELTVNVLESQAENAQARTDALKKHIDDMLKKYQINGEVRLMGHSGTCKLAVPISYQHRVGSISILRNFQSRHDHSLDLSIEGSLLATLATPPLFVPTSIFQHATTSHYISAELALSNPTREIIAEAYEVFGAEATVACILSIGSGHLGIVSASGDPDTLDWNRMLETIVTDGEQKAQSIDSQMGHLDLYYRFSVTRGLERTSLDHPTPGVILSHTTAYLAEHSITRSIDRCAHSLKTRDGGALLGQLKHSGGQTALPPALPPLARNFVIRKIPWDFIENAMFQIGNTGQALLGVTGIGGCGKTQLVLKFIRVYGDKFLSIMFIDGSSEEHIRADIVRNVRALGREYSQMGLDESLAFLSQRPSGYPRLILYDNVDDPNIDLLSFFPRGDNCAIIITSRNRSIGAICPDAHLELDQMTIDEAVELLLYASTQRGTTTTRVREDARAIAETLGCLPIALQQAYSYMYETRCSAGSYLNRLVTGRNRLLALPAKYQREMRYLSTYAAFDASFAVLEERNQKFLRLLSYFHWVKFPLELIMLAAAYNFAEYEAHYTKPGTEYIIGKAVLEDIFLCKGEWSVEDQDNLVISLQNYSLVTVIPVLETTLLQMHPLVHQWVNSGIPEEKRDEYQAAAVLLLALGARDDWTSSAQYLTGHVTFMTSIWHKLHLNDLGAFGLILNDAGRFAAALKLREKVVAELRVQDHTCDCSLLKALCYLATTMHDWGRVEEAEQLQQEIYSLTIHHYGPHHPAAIIVSNDLAMSYAKLGRADEARQLQEDGLLRSKLALGERHPDTITTANNLAVTYCSLGMLQEAASLQENTLQLRKEVMGERHPHTGEAMLALAGIYEHLDEPEPALQLLTTAGDIFLETLGQSHPHYTAYKEAKARVERLANIDILELEITEA